MACAGLSYLHQQQSALFIPRHYGTWCTLTWRASPSLAGHNRRAAVPATQASAAGLAAVGTAFSQPIANIKEKSRAFTWLGNKHDAEIWQVALPAFVAMLMDPISGALNTAMVGHLGTQQLGAVSMGNLIVSFCTFMFSFLLFLTTPEVAAAVAGKDKAQVSRTVAKGFWLGGGLGISTSAAVFLGADAIVLALNPPEATLAASAVQYIRCRAVGIAANLLHMVATGTFRGFKDTRTPLVAAAIAAGTTLSLNFLFIYGFGWGAMGAGLATSISQLASASFLCYQLMSRGLVFQEHLAHPPPLSCIAGTLRAGAILAFRNLISFGMIMYASTLCVRAGSAYQAGFEVVRQVWMLAMPFFDCLNVATQSLCASLLGAKDALTARSVLSRIMFLGSMVGIMVGSVVWFVHEPFVGLFTTDGWVVSQVTAALPMLCLLFPLDCIASIADGSLLAAKQTDYMSAVQIAGSLVQYAALLYISANGMISVLSIWGTLKLLTLFRVAGGCSRSFFSSHSAYRAAPSSADAAASSAASLVGGSSSAASVAAPTTSASSASASFATAATSALTAAAPEAAASQTSATPSSAPVTGAIVQNTSVVQRSHSPMSDEASRTSPSPGSDLTTSASGPSHTIQQGATTQWPDVEEARSSATVHQIATPPAVITSTVAAAAIASTALGTSTAPAGGVALNSDTPSSSISQPSVVIAPVAESVQAAMSSLSTAVVPSPAVQRSSHDDALPPSSESASQQPIATLVGASDHEAVAQGAVAPAAESTSPPPLLLASVDVDLMVDVDVAHTTAAVVPAACILCDAKVIGKAFSQAERPAAALQQQQLQAVVNLQAAVATDGINGINEVVGVDESNGFSDSRSPGHVDDHAQTQMNQDMSIKMEVMDGSTMGALTEGHADLVVVGAQGRKVHMASSSDVLDQSSRAVSRPNQ